MKTERDLFREWYENAYHEIINILPSGQYASLRQQHSWDAWTASAQREGYKLVPLQPSNEVIIAIEKKVENQLEASGINQDPFRLDGETIYEAMIGGAE